MKNVMQKFNPPKHGARLHVAAWCAGFVRLENIAEIYSAQDSDDF